MIRLSRALTAVVLAAALAGCVRRAQPAPLPDLPVHTPTPEVAAPAADAEQPTPFAPGPTAERPPAVEAQSLAPAAEARAPLPDAAPIAAPPAAAGVLVLRGAELWMAQPAAEPGPVVALPAGVGAVVPSPAGRYAALATGDGVALLDAQTGAVAPLANAVGPAVWSPTGDALYTASTAGGVLTVRRHDPATGAGEIAAEAAAPADSVFALRAVLPDGTALFADRAAADPLDERVSVLAPGGELAPLPAPAFDGVRLLDVSPGGGRALFLDVSYRAPLGSDIAIPLFEAALDPAAGLRDAREVAGGDFFTYLDAAYAPDGSAIAVVRAAVPAPPGGPTELVRLDPDGEGGYDVTVLDPPVAGQTHALGGWHPAGVVAARAAADGSEAVWLFAPGAEPSLLAEGSAPAVLPLPTP